jgi:hypothetical protein
VLEVFASRTYTSAGPFAPCGGEGVGSDQLCGVFLAVGANDGGVYIVDVYDMDLHAPSPRVAECEDAPAVVRRHRMRLRDLAEGGVDIVTGPDVTVDGVRGTVGEDGVTSLDRAPGLASLAGGCPAHYAELFGDRICGLDDPWEVRAETWSVTWEGLLQGGARGGRGRFERDAMNRVVLRGEVPFCTRGVLGGANVAGLPADEPEAGYAGDLLVVAGAPPPAPPESVTGADADLRRACEAVFGEQGPIELIDVPILESFEDRLVLGTPRFDPSVAGSLLGPLVGMSAADVLLACYPELVSYEVRVQGCRVDTRCSARARARRSVSSPTRPTDASST